MVIAILPKKIMLFLFKNFNENNTISSIAKELSMNRVGIWRTLKKLESKNLVNLIQVGNGKTNTQLIKLNWNNFLIEKLLALYLTEEALQEQRLIKDFEKLNVRDIENIVDFLIIHKNNIISVVSQKRKIIKIHPSEEFAEEKINSINLTELEFVKELMRPNKDFVDSVREGSVLLGQEKFIQLIKQIHLKKIGF